MFVGPSTELNVKEGQPKIKIYVSRFAICSFFFWGGRLEASLLSPYIDGNSRVCLCEV